jgi:acetyl-CoA carboxylase biotin carboxylase subunit
MINKVLIANRGEIALRIIRACKELGLKTVAIYSEADKTSLHVRFADEAVCIGPAESAKSYLNIPSIIAAAEVTNADAIHPGYGFMAENDYFVDVCNDHDIIFIGPSADSIRRMGNKSVAKETMRQAGVPVIPGSVGIIKDVTEGKKLANGIGYPVLLKAVAGGGGKGMRIVNSEQEFEKSYNLAQNEAKSFFNNPDLYMEKLIQGSRHIEIQVLGDKKGNIIHLNERECSIQRRHQKLIEEAPSPVVSQALRDKMGESSKLGAEAVNYVGPGTIEYLVDNEMNFFFMEMNTRIQVEHPVTEESVNVDLIKEQIMIAAGEKITAKESKPKLHAIECRINAEDPYNDFRPSPGMIDVFHAPGGHGVRVDSHIYSGYFFPPNYDSLAGKIITYSKNRNDAIQKMKRALDEFVIEGIKTTIPFHQAMMNNPDFNAGKIDTKYLERNDWKSFEIS